MDDIDIKRFEVSEDDKNFLAYFYKSFYFSQGRLGVQQDMLRWLIDQDYLKKEYFEINNDINFAGGMDEHAEALISRLSVPHSHDARLPKSARNFDSQFDQIRGDGSMIEPITESADVFVGNLLEKWVARDIRFVGTMGRSVRKTSETVDLDGVNDNYGSQFRRFVLQGKPTGLPGFDSLMKEFQNFYEKSDKNSPVRQKVENLKKAWEEKHPGMIFEA